MGIYWILYYQGSVLLYLFISLFLSIHSLGWLFLSIHRDVLSIWLARIFSKRSGPPTLKIIFSQITRLGAWIIFDYKWLGLSYTHFICGYNYKGLDYYKQIKYLL